MEWYQEKLVAIGYTQTYEVIYQKTFAPIEKMNSINILIFVAANQRWLLLQLDVKNVFMHGDLKEVVYMSLSPGFQYSTGKGKVSHLKKAIYNLKQ